MFEGREYIDREAVDVFYKPFWHYGYSPERRELRYPINRNIPAMELVIPKAFSIEGTRIISPLEEEMDRPRMLSCAFVDGHGNYTNPLDTEKILIYAGWSNTGAKIPVSLNEAKSLLSEDIQETDNAFL